MPSSPVTIAACVFALPHQFSNWRRGSRRTMDFGKSMRNREGRVELVSIRNLTSKYALSRRRTVAASGTDFLREARTWSTDFGKCRFGGSPLGEVGVEMRLVEEGANLFPI